MGRLDRVRREGNEFVCGGHDAKLDRLTHDRGRLLDKTATEICGSKFGNSNDRIQRFEEFLEQIGGRVPLLIEIKNPTVKIGPLEQSIANGLLSYRGEAAVMSFNPRSIAWFCSQRPEIMRGQLSEAHLVKKTPYLSWAQRFAAQHLLVSFLSKPDFIGYDVKGLPQLSTRIARWMGIPVLTWTAKTEEDLLTAEHYADNVIFENVRPPLPDGSYTTD